MKFSEGLSRVVPYGSWTLLVYGVVAIIQTDPVKAKLLEDDRFLVVLIAVSIGIGSFAKHVLEPVLKVVCRAFLLACGCLCQGLWTAVVFLLCKARVVTPKTFKQVRENWEELVKAPFLPPALFQSASEVAEKKVAPSKPSQGVSAPRIGREIADLEGPAPNTRQPRTGVRSSAPPPLESGPRPPPPDVDPEGERESTETTTGGDRRVVGSDRTRGSG